MPEALIGKLILPRGSDRSTCRYSSSTEAQPGTRAARHDYFHIHTRSQGAAIWTKDTSVITQLIADNGIIVGTAYANVRSLMQAVVSPILMQCTSTGRITACKNSRGKKTVWNPHFQPCRYPRKDARDGPVRTAPDRHLGSSVYASAVHTDRHLSGKRQAAGFHSMVHCGGHGHTLKAVVLMPCTQNEQRGADVAGV